MRGRPTDGWIGQCIGRGSPSRPVSLDVPGLHPVLPRGGLAEALAVPWRRSLFLHTAPRVASARNACTWVQLVAMGPMSSSKTAIEVFA